MESPLSVSAFSAQPSQAERIKERKLAQTTHVQVCGVDFLIDRGVYGTSVDTELMVETVCIGKEETFMEIGCGSGAVSLLLAKKCLRGLSTDINFLAVANAQTNSENLGITNVSFIVGDGFADVTEKFNVLICNPPYNNYPAADPIERMFWDPNDEVKKSFFEEAKQHLLSGGRIYFGWANFSDIDVALPLVLAENNGLTLVRTAERSSRSGKYNFFVFEFKQTDFVPKCS